MRRLIRVSLALTCLAALVQAGSAQEVQLISHRGPGCCDAPCPTANKGCVPVPDKIKKTTVLYACKEKDYCLPKCSHSHGCFLAGLFGHGGCNDCNACPADCGPLGNCGHPRTKNVLLKKSVTTEC